jgi:hypothetical protein
MTQGWKSRVVVGINHMAVSERLALLSRPVALATAGVMTASFLVALSDEVDAVNPCRVKTSTRLDSTTHFAGGAVLRRYSGRAHGSAVGGYDQRAKVVMATYPKRAFPALIHAKVGERQPIGTLVRNQRPKALAAINGDFFIFPDIRGVKDIEMSRGPMVRNGRIIRGTDKRQRVVGVTKRRKPFGGLVSVSGSVRAEGSPATLPVRTLNWQRV